MAVTLSSVAVAAWRELGWGYVVKATGGSTTTLVDSNTLETATDAKKGGTIIVVYDAGGASAAPEGEFSRISAFNAGTFTFTVDAALTAAIASGDRVMIANPKITLQNMIDAINGALRDLGRITLINTSLTSAVQQTEYALTVGLKQADIIDVLYNTKLNDTNDYQWESIKSQSRVETSAAGTSALLYLPQLPTGRTIRIIYEGTHPLLTAFSSVVSETIPEQLIIDAAINKALTWFVSKRGESALGTFVLQRWNDAKQTLANRKAEMPIFKAKPKPRYFVGRGGTHPYIDSEHPIV